MFCPRCGRQNSETETTCSQCGYSLREAAQKIVRPTGATPAVSPNAPASLPPPPHQPHLGTMIGVAVPPVSDGAVAHSTPKPTPLPVARPTQQPAAKPTPLPLSALQNQVPHPRMGTMMGFAVPPQGAPAPPRETPTPPSVSPSQYPQLGVPPSQAPHPRMGTMVGFAVPPIGAPAPTPPSSPPSLGPQRVPTPAPPQANAAPSALPRLGTMMGFAVPPEGSPAPLASPVQSSDAALHRLLEVASRRVNRGPAEALGDALARHGTGLLSDAARCEHEMWGDYGRDVRLLRAALEEGIPQQLLARARGGLQAAHITTLARGLAETRGIAEEAAEFAVAAWALALRPMLGA